MLSPLRKRAGRRLREPFGKAGLTVAVIALVFAMLGGAYAATGLNSKQKKEVKSIAKSFQGAGPAGAQGPAGAKGDAGAAGANGKDGTNGANGKNAEAIPFSGSKTIGSVTCTEGGLEVKSAGATTLVCNGAKGIQGEPGEDGETGFTETLPSGKTETGTVGGQINELGTGEATSFSISFPIPLASPIAESNVINVLSVESPVNEHCDNGVGAAPSVNNPEADPGYLCIFQGSIGKPVGAERPDGNGGAAVSGTLAIVLVGFGGRMDGSWAVTAP
jgi:hypothetical protein